MPWTSWGWHRVDAWVMHAPSVVFEVIGSEGETEVLEFIVEGTPRSLQGSSRSKTEWKLLVGAKALSAADGGDARLEHVDVWVRIVHFCVGWDDNAGDLDNICKPILDAVSGPAIFNDSQVKELLARRTDLRQHDLTQLEGATPLLMRRLGEALRAPDDDLGFVYIAIGTDIDHARMP